MKECRILQTFVREVSQVFEVQVGDESIGCSAEHPFWVIDRGWTHANKLQVGDALITSEGKVVTVQAVRSSLEKVRVYNFEVEELHTYFVSDLGILVHNTCRPPGVGGNGAASELPDLRNLSRQNVQDELRNSGFTSTQAQPSAGGWQKFRHPDGSQVDVNWQQGRIVRTAAPRYGSDGSRINKGQRLSYDGSEIPRSIRHEDHPPEFFDINT